MDFLNLLMWIWAKILQKSACHYHFSLFLFICFAYCQSNNTSFLTVFSEGCNKLSSTQSFQLTLWGRFIIRSPTLCLFFVSEWELENHLSSSHFGKYPLVKGAKAHTFCYSLQRLFKILASSFLTILKFINAFRKIFFFFSLAFLVIFHEKS